ncbi:hypothetical protein JKP88DRAFT_278089 [Tribonema minus]|uniref:Uncharacterized protein n=1 Tax=Tribonema minus TaxID=303371 RepID=A0A836CDG7_9STRA|nr:hypothetical protein JKP88DRAFT_278089 [Tribonema minus]
MKAATIIVAVAAVVGFASAAPDTRCPTTATPEDFPKCVTYYFEGQQQCITSFDGCEPVAACANVMWDGAQALCFDGCASADYDNGVPVCLATDAEGACVVVWPVAACANVMWDGAQALCFDGCASADYDNGVPVCLATDAEGACVVVWNGGVPSCLTDHCNARVEGCDSIGWCHEAGQPSGEGVFCFDTCAPRGINWSSDGLPQCANGTTPCPAGRKPHCYEAGGTYAPTMAPSAAPTAGPTAAAAAVAAGAATRNLRATVRALGGQFFEQIGDETFQNTSFPYKFMLRSVRAFAA